MSNLSLEKEICLFVFLHVCGSAFNFAICLFAHITGGILISFI